MLGCLICDELQESIQLFANGFKYEFKLLRTQEIAVVIEILDQLKYKMLLLLGSKEKGAKVEQYQHGFLYSSSGAIFIC